MTQKNYKVTYFELGDDLAEKFRLVADYYGGDKTAALRALIIAEYRRIKQESVLGAPSKKYVVGAQGEAIEVPDQSESEQQVNRAGSKGARKRSRHSE